MIIPSFGVPSFREREREASTPDLREGSERNPSPAPTVASSIDAQIAGLAGYDTSAYNTDYEEDLVPRDQDGGGDTDGDVDIADADPIERAVAYMYATRHA